MFENGVVVAIRLQLALLWWKLCAFLLRMLHVQSLKPASQYFHKVVVIGDDFAAGVGDYITIGNSAGLAQYLAPLVKRSDKVRHTWEIINAGVPGSTSADWLLNSAKQCYNRVFTSRSMGDAEIVIVMLGSAELRYEVRFSRTSACVGENPTANTVEIKKNLISICDTLRKKGKHVCLATAASPEPLKSETATIPLNIALEEFCKSTSTDDIPVVLGPRLDTYAFRRESSLAYDHFHFNSTLTESCISFALDRDQSYKLLARNAADFLIPMMTAVEWTTWKKQLNQVTYDKTLFD